MNSGQYENMKQKYILFLQSQTRPNKVSAIAMLIKDFGLTLNQAAEIVTFFDSDKSWDEVPKWLQETFRPHWRGQNME